jgi:hypothetical protein
VYVFVWRETLQILSGQDRGQNFRSGGCFSGQWFEVELLFLDFLCQLNAADRHGRRLESLESEHRPDSLLYPAKILLEYWSSYRTADREVVRKNIAHFGKLLAQAKELRNDNNEPGKGGHKILPEAPKITLAQGVGRLRSRTCFHTNQFPG